jgi:hypothetical protein
LPEQSGVSKTSGKEWKLQAYVLETQEQYPRKVHFEVFGEDRIKANPCQLDDIVTVSFDIESREFNGRWYTSIRAWKVVLGDTTQAAQPATAAPTTPVAPAAAPQPATESIEAANVQPFDPTVNDNTSDLPF